MSNPIDRSLSSIYSFYYSKGPRKTLKTAKIAKTAKTAYKPAKTTSDERIDGTAVTEGLELPS